MRRVQENQEGLKMNGTHHVSAYAYDVNVVEGNIDTIQKNTALLDAHKETDLEVNPEKTKYMLMSCNQKTGQKYGIKRVNRSFEDMVKLKYLGKTSTDENTCKNRLRADYIQGMLATIRFRVFCLPACC
jgi:hypothetical protein